MARTPQGAVALNVIPLEARMHAKGPLVYGVFSALPSELTVLGANGSSLYTEDLRAKATEAAQFCEGYGRTVTPTERAEVIRTGCGVLLHDPQIFAIVS